MTALPQASLRTIGRLALAAALAVALGSDAAHAADGLATKPLQKAAVGCQKVIAQVTAQVVTGKFKALDACLNAGLSCVQTKHDQGGCFLKASQTCAKKLRGAAATIAKAETKIATAKSCATQLRLEDVLSADGLGLGAAATFCQVELGLDVCSGLDAVAACLVRAHERSAAGLYGLARPRAAELLALAADVVVPPTEQVPPVDGLPVFAGCSTCSVALDDRKPVEQCGTALTKATQSLIGGLEKQFGTCAQAVFACEQANDSSCLTKAATKCDKAAGKIRTGLEKFASAVTKKCGAGVVSFERLADPSGLNLAALSSQCGTLTSDGALATCLQERVRCGIATLARRAIARVDELGADGKLATLGADLTAACPSPVATPSLTAARYPRVFFGSIGKLLKTIRRPSTGVFGIRTAGSRPTSTKGAGFGVTSVKGPPRVTFGAVHKIPFRYSTGGAGGGANAAAALTAEPPILIVTIQRDDLTIEDHYEIALDPPPATPTEVDDELEVTYGDAGDFPGCAFELGFATRIGGVTSAYTPLLQVVDTAATPTPAPLVTATAPTPFPTATLSSATGTPTPTTTAPTPTPTATIVVPTPTATETPPAPGPFIAAPRVAIIRPGPGAANGGPNVVVAEPDVKVIRPGPGTSSGFLPNVSVARPSVEIVRPGSGSSSGLSPNVSVARPSVEVIRPGLGSAGSLAPNVTVARPPVSIEIQGP